MVPVSETHPLNQCNLLVGPGDACEINSAVAEVKAAGRLRWCAKDVRRVIVPYPKQRHADAILELQGDDTWRPEGVRAYVDDEADTSAFGGDDEIEAEAEDRDDEGEAEADSHPDGRIRSRMPTRRAGGRPR